MKRILQILSIIVLSTGLYVPIRICLFNSEATNSAMTASAFLIVFGLVSFGLPSEK